MSQIQSDTIVKSILNIRCREGSTIGDIIDEYKEITGENWFYADKKSSETINYLMSLDSVWKETVNDGIPRFYIRSEKSKHISELISKQRNDIEKKISVKRDTFKKSCSSQNNSKSKRYSKKAKRVSFNLNETKSNDSIVQIIGDNLFVKKVIMCHAASPNRNQSTRYIHLCKSGLSILETAKYFECKRMEKSSTVIINIGMEDIFRGSSISELCSDFDYLINVCIRNGFQPIISTLAPLPRANHSPYFHQILQYFNINLLDNYSTRYDIIDNWSETIPTTAYLYEI